MNDEKIIIEGEILYKTLSKKLVFIIPLCCVLLWIVVICINGKGVDFYIPFDILYEYNLFDLCEYFDMLVPIYATMLTILSIVSIFLYLTVNKVNLTLTNKRIYGNLTFGRKLDLPINQIAGVTKMRNDQFYITLLGNGNIIDCSFIKNTLDFIAEINKIVETNKIIIKEKNRKFGKHNGYLVTFAKNEFSLDNVDFFIEAIKEWIKRTGKSEPKIFIFNKKHSLKGCEKRLYEFFESKQTKHHTLKVTFIVDDEQYITTINLN